GKAATESCRKTPAILRRNLMATAHTLEQESNPWEQQAARFNLAAEKLKLDEGLWRVLQQPNREIIVHIPVAMDNGQLEVFTGYRVQPSIARGPRQRRSAVFARCDPRRSARPGELDDLEVRGGEYPVRRGQGRHHLRSQEHVARRTGAHDPALYLGADRVYRPGEGCSGARRQHQ